MPLKTELTAKNGGKNIYLETTKNIQIFSVQSWIVTVKLDWSDEIIKVMSDNISTTYGSWRWKNCCVLKCGCALLLVNKTKRFYAIIPRAWELIYSLTLCSSGIGNDVHTYVCPLKCLETKRQNENLCSFILPPSFSVRNTWKFWSFQ